MRILLVGVGGVGAAFAAIAARRDFYETIVVADYDPARAERAAGLAERLAIRPLISKPQPPAEDGSSQFTLF